MAYSRPLLPAVLPEGEMLTSALIGIGMNFAGEGAADSNIEDALLAASVEGMERDDLRVLSVLATWMDVHHPWVNADRLHRGAEALTAPRVRAFWSTIGHWLRKDRRFDRFTALHRGRRVPLLRVGNEFQTARRGEDPRFRGTALLVPAGVLRDRRADVMVPMELARRHTVYRRRVQMGPSYRADMWAELERDPAMTPSDLARASYGSFATAWQVKKDWALLGGDG